MAPRSLFAMIDEYLDIGNYEAMIFALANNGQDLPTHKKNDVETVEVYVHPDAF